MKELVIKKAGSFIDKISQSSRELELLAKKENSEIMFQRLAAGTKMVLSPNTADIMEFFYMLEGEIRCEYEDSIELIEKGDYFYINSLPKSVNLTIQKDSELLYVTTHPVYDAANSMIRELEDISFKVREKDLYTYEHNNRLHDYSLLIAKKLNLSKESMDKLVFAARFHDIGKINVPDYILQKPGMLNEEEFGFIKLHPSDGKQIISRTYIKMIGDIIEQHHERIDGSGYPYGLKSEDILLEAKIIAVADSYDAMTTDRPYRKAMNPTIAITELERLAGIHYEKDIVEVFKDLLIEQGVLDTQL